MSSMVKQELREFSVGIFGLQVIGPYGFGLHLDYY